MKIVELAVDYNGDADFTDLRKRMVNESRFNRQYERATITFYLKQSRDRFNIHWIAPSQVVHGSVMDVLAAWKLEEAVDGSMSATGELESLMPFPNGALLDSCQFAVHTSLLVEEEFNLPESPERPPLLSKLVQALTRKLTLWMRRYRERRGSQTAALMAKACIFCGSSTNKITREHIVADWISDLFSGYGRATAGIISRDRSMQQYQAALFQQTTRQVCTSCNSGWMSQLERGVSPPLALRLRHNL